MTVADQRFCELIASRGGSPEHPDPAITWAAFLEFVELPVAYGEPPGPLDADMLPVDLLIDDGEISVSFARNMFRPWSEAFSGDPIHVGASFRYVLTPDLQDVRELALSGIGGPIEDPTGPLFRPGVDRPSVTPRSAGGRRRTRTPTLRASSPPRRGRRWSTSMISPRTATDHRLSDGAVERCALLL